MDECIFCKIIQGEIPAAKIWEDDNHLAFLDVHPNSPGHTLVIPKKHIPYIFDLEDTELTQLILACKPIAQALKETFHPPTGLIGLKVVGTGVAHTHIHLIPFNKEEDLNIKNAKQNTTPQNLQENAQKIKENLPK